MRAEKGRKVKFHFTGRFEDDRVFATSRDSKPMEAVLGEGDLIPSFEEAIMGMRLGERKQFELAPERTYGERKRGLVKDVKKDDFFRDARLFVGKRVHLMEEDGSVVHATVSRVGQRTVTLDTNHPLAGRTLRFDVQIVDVA